MKKKFASRFLSVLLSLTMVILMIPMGVFAIATEYDVKVGDVWFTSVNTVIDSTDIPGVTGTATYENGTLILDDFVYSGAGYNYDGASYAAIYSEVGLNIKYTGTNQITAIGSDEYDNSYAIYCTGSLDFVADSSNETYVLYAAGGKAKNISAGIRGSMVTFRSGNITAIGDEITVTGSDNLSTGVYSSSNEIRGGTVTAIGKSKALKYSANTGEYSHLSGVGFYYGETEAAALAAGMKNAAEVTADMQNGYRYYECKFARFCPYEAPSITVTVNPSDSAHGSVTSSSNNDGSVTVTATPNDGYTFTGWQDASGNIVSTANPYTFTPNASVTLTAVFTATSTTPPGGNEGNTGGNEGTTGGNNGGSTVQPTPPVYIPVYEPVVREDGWQKMGKGWYVYEDNARVKGWYKWDNVWYYLAPGNGRAYAGGIYEIDGEKYYFYDWCGMASAWWYEDANGDWFYFFGSGEMAVSEWVEWKGGWYYCGEDGKMLTDTTTPDGYYVNADGLWVE